MSGYASQSLFGFYEPCLGAMAISSVCVEVFSRWFSAMREAIGRERSRQADFRIRNGLPKRARVPYDPPALTEAESAVSSMAESVTRSLFGDGAADYARDKFRRAVETGDKRAFKIRLLVLRVRDSIPDQRIRRLFSEYANSCIDAAEKKAGCVPDGSPRRMSKLEQERKKRIMSKREAKTNASKMQMEIPLVWDGVDNDKQEHKGRVADISEASGLGTDEVKKELKINNLNFGVSLGIVESQDIENIKDCNPTNENGRNVTVTEGVTVTKTLIEKNESSCDSTPIGRADPVRKTRNYLSVKDILDDIESGRIVPYESVEEIISDLRSGLITQVEALLFTAALDEYCPDEPVGTDFEDVEQYYECAEGYCDEEEEKEDQEEDQEEYEEEDRLYGRSEDFRPGVSFSYNPNGFGGVDGGFGADEW